MRKSTESIAGNMTECVLFDSISDLTDSLRDAMVDHQLEESRQVYAKAGTYMRCGEHLNGWDWVGRMDLAAMSCEEVLQAVEGNWDEGLRLFDECEREIANEELPTPQRVSRQRCHRPDDGDDICLDRMRSGQDYWQATHRQPQTGPQTITLVCNQGALASKSAQDIIWRGLATVILADKLEAAGYRVEIISASHAVHAYESKRDAATNVLTVVKQKDGYQMLDRSGLINGTSGWFFRTCVFATRTMPEKSRLRSFGLGATSSLLPAMHLIAPHAENPIVVEGFYNKSSCVKFLRETLTKFAAGELQTATM